MQSRAWDTHVVLQPYIRRQHKTGEILNRVNSS